ncbi:MAG: hypothetical protein GX077_03750 [Tissierellia bacterium]|nr:hypothetical protein [Tissierellia bacterium]
MEKILDKDKYKEFPLEISYTTTHYYDVVRNPKEIFSISLVKRPFDKVIKKSFIGKLYEGWLENPSAFPLTKDGQVLS